VPAWTIAPELLSGNQGTCRSHVLILAKDLYVRIIARDTAELLRELVLNTAQDYQPQPKT